MSATFDVDVFSDYFRVPKGDGMVMAPVIDITKMQPYTVNVYYLNQFKQLLDTSVSIIQIFPLVLSIYHNNYFYRCQTFQTVNR